MHSLFGGFLLRRSCGHGACAPHPSDVPSTGRRRVPRGHLIRCLFAVLARGDAARKDVLHRMHVRLLRVAAGYTGEHGLHTPVVRMRVSALSALPARVRGVYRNLRAAGGGCLVLKLAPELAPGRVEDASVQARLGAAAWAAGRGAHGLHLQVFERGEQLLRALKMIYPSATLIGASVLHANGWTTQIPRELHVAVEARPSYSELNGVRLHPRPLEWFRTVQSARGFDTNESSHRGLRALDPAWALADMRCDGGDWVPEEDDLDLPDDGEERVGQALALLIGEDLRERPVRRRKPERG